MSALRPLKGCPHAAAEATEAATAAPRRIAGAPTHGHVATREAAMAAFAKSWRHSSKIGRCAFGRKPQNICSF